MSPIIKRLKEANDALTELLDSNEEELESWWQTLEYLTAKIGKMQYNLSAGRTNRFHS